MTVAVVVYCIVCAVLLIGIILYREVEDDRHLKPGKNHDVHEGTHTRH